MNFLSKSVLLASAAVVMPITPALAQEADSDAGTSASEAPNDIIVTARKTKETLRDSPVAVSVVTGEFLDRTGFTQVVDVVRFVPGISLSPLNTTRANGSKIRGISTFSFSDGSGHRDHRAGDSGVLQHHPRPPRADCQSVGALNGEMRPAPSADHKPPFTVASTRSLIYSRRSKAINQAVSGWQSGRLRPPWPSARPESINPLRSASGTARPCAARRGHGSSSLTRYVLPGSSPPKRTWGTS